MGCKPTPPWLFVYRTCPPPPTVYQMPTCTDYFSYRYTSMISAEGALFYRIISFFVDYIGKKLHFLPQNLQNLAINRSYFVWNQYRLIISHKLRNKQLFQMFVYWNFCHYRAHFLRYYNRSSENSLMELESSLINWRVLLLIEYMSIWRYNFYGAPIWHIL